MEHSSLKKPLNLLIVAMKYGYGDERMGYSYEWNHFYLGLKSVFSKVKFFDFMSHYQESGKQEMQKKLQEVVLLDRPDVILFVPYTDQFDVSFIHSLRNKTKILCFFHDDSWRQAFVKTWAPHVDAFTSSAWNAKEKYHELGFDHAVSFPFGVNQYLFCCDESKRRDIDVSFVGAWHPYRAWLIRQLEKTGVTVTVSGHRWPNGIVDTASMVDIFQRSKISLTLSNSLHLTPSYLLSSPRALLNAMRSPKQGEQIKGRHFEVPACGALQLSFNVEGLDRLFVPNKEVVLYNCVSELKEKVSYYLSQPLEREQIASAGYQRVLREHTYAARFMSVLRKLGWIKE